MDAEFLEFDAEDFPIKIEAVNLSGETVWSTTAEGPGGMDIPYLAGEHGPVGIRVYTNGVLAHDIPAPRPGDIA